MNYFIPLKKIALASFVCAYIQILSIHAQDNVGIGTNTPDASAVLEMLSTNKGLLIPRMTTAQRLSISPSAANSLLVYDIDSMCFFFYRQPNLNWVSLCNSGSGNNGTNTIDTLFANFINVDSIIALYLYADSIFAHYIQSDTIIANYANFDSLFINGVSIQQLISDSIASKAWLLQGNTGTNPSVNFIGTTDAADMVVKTNGTERMRVLSGGNVGIGTSTPGTQLEVAGQVKITGGSPGIGKVLTSDASGLATWQSPFPPGIIVMWAGTISTIPAGWALCDGTSGTPNLSDKFILGVSSSSEDPGATGGAHSYNLTASQLPSHTHTFTTSTGGSHSHTFTTNSSGAHTHSFFWDASAKNDCSGVSAVITGASSGNCGTAYSPNPTEGTHTHTGTSDAGGSHNHTGTTDPTGSGGSIDNRPAYYKLAYIMKL